MIEMIGHINIGRNVTMDDGSQEPMSVNDWVHFHINIEQVCEAYGELVGRFISIAHWDGEQEESVSYLLTYDLDAELHLRDALAKIARIYNQQAIGLIAMPVANSLVEAGE